MQETLKHASRHTYEENDNENMTMLKNKLRKPVKKKEKIFQL